MTSDTPSAAPPSEINRPDNLTLTGDILDPPPAWSTSDGRSTRRFQSRTPFTGYIPSREQSEELLNAYIDGYHCLVPLIHVPSFLERCDRFWLAVETSSLPTASDPFLSLFLAVCFAGSITYTSNKIASIFDGRAREDVATDLRQSAIKAIRGASFPRTPTLETLTAYIICQASWMRGKLYWFTGTSLYLRKKFAEHLLEEEPLSCW
jgi:hypothetical protein